MQRKGVYDECHVYKPYIVAHWYVSTCWLHVYKMADTCAGLSTHMHCVWDTRISHKTYAHTHCTTMHYAWYIHSPCQITTRSAWERKLPCTLRRGWLSRNIIVLSWTPIATWQVFGTMLDSLSHYAKSVTTHHLSTSRTVRECLAYVISSHELLTNQISFFILRQYSGAVLGLQISEQNTSAGPLTFCKVRDGLVQ